MNELEAKCYLTKQGGANNSDQHCIYRGIYDMVPRLIGELIIDELRKSTLPYFLTNFLANDFEVQKIAYNI